MSEQTGYTIETEGVKFATPSRILTRVMDSVALLNIAKTQRAFDPAIFDETPPFFMPVEMSNRNVDSYFTHMDDTSLRNFAADAAAGIPFQDSHSTNMGLGISLTGSFDGERTIGDFLIQPNIRFGGQGSYESSNDFIAQARAGVARDTSVGFHFPNTDPNIFAGIRCDICGENMMRWDCPHIPGLTYEISGEGGTMSRVIALGTVLNAHAAEQSCAYAGATPGAAILKAQAEASLGRLTPKEARFLEDRYRNQNLKLADVKQIFRLGSVEGERIMADDKTKETETKRHPDDVAQQNQIRTVLTTAGFADNQDPIAAITAMSDELVTLRKMKDDQPALNAKAKDGEAYRKSLIDQVVAEGIRACGKATTGRDFDEVGTRKLFESADLETIKAQAEQYRLIGDKLFPGGRATTDGKMDDAATVRRAEPVNAYRV